MSGRSNMCRHVPVLVCATSFVRIGTFFYAKVLEIFTNSFVKTVSIYISLYFILIIRLKGGYI